MLSLSEEEQERIRRAYFIEHKSIRTIAKEMKHGRSTVTKVIAQETSQPQQVTNNRHTPVFVPHQARMEELLSPNEHLPPKQHSIPQPLPKRFYITPLVVIGIILLTLVSFFGILEVKISIIFSCLTLLFTYLQWAFPLTAPYVPTPHGQQNQLSWSPQFFFQNIKQSKVARISTLIVALFFICSIVLMIVQPWPHYSQIPYPPNKGILALNDTLTGSDNNKDWAISQSDFGFCQFIGSEYHVSEKKEGYNYSCLAKTPQFSDFVYQIEMNILKGAGGGIIFRADGSLKNYYRLDISRFIVAAHYRLWLIADGNGTLLREDFISPTFFNAGGSNTIAIVARGETITFYMNGQEILSIDNGAYSKGGIGVSAFALNSQQDNTIDSQSNGPAEVSFRDARVWTL